jgi:hypothetical protein
VYHRLSEKLPFPKVRAHGRACCSPASMHAHTHTASCTHMHAHTHAHSIHSPQRTATHERSW